MEKSTNQLIEELANKLGTTTEYLWKVLLKQAPIDATTTLFQCLLIWFGGVVLYKLHRKFSKEEEGQNSLYYDKEEALIVPMIIATIIWAIFFIASFFSIESIINGYFNPEYWALHKILSNG